MYCLGLFATVQVLLNTDPQISFVGSGERYWSMHGTFLLYATEVFQGIGGSRRQGHGSWSHHDVLCGYGQRTLL